MKPIKALPVLFLIIGAILLSACDTQAETPTPTLLATDIPTPTKVNFLNHKYIPEGDPDQRLDVYVPEEAEKPFPTILMIHGGGFRSGNKTSYIPIAKYLNNLGYAVVSTDYRLTPNYSYPAQVEDVFCALAWVHTNHEIFGFDTKRIVVWGGSAGGYLAAMIGTVDDPSLYLATCPQQFPESDWVKGVIVFYGFFDVTNVEGHRPIDVKSSLEPFIGGEHSKIPSEKLVEMSPISYVDGSEPPFLLLHGTADTTLQSKLSEDFATRLEQAGADVELVLLPEVGHAFELKPLDGEEMTLALLAVDTFLDRVLSPSY